MIDLVIGVPGSGKTYFSVFKVFELCKSQKKQFKHIFTNINGLDYKKCNDIANKADFVKPFDFQDLQRQIANEFNTYEQVKNGYLQVPDYDEFLKSEHILEDFYHSLIIIDECHLYFNEKVDESLIRFLSYHRHFNIDMILLTQNKNLVNKKYLSFIETMYKALPGSKRFFSNVFRYKKYASYQEYNNNLINTVSLKLKSEVFTLYNSGSTKLTKSILHKLLLPVFALSLFVFLFYHYFISSRFDPPSVKNTSAIIKSNIDSNISSIPHQKLVNDDNFIHNPNKKFYMISCFKNSCSFAFSSFSFDKPSMFSIFDKFKCKIFVNRTFTSSYHTYIVSCYSELDDFLNATKKDFRNEKVNNSSSSVSQSLLK